MTKPPSHDDNSEAFAIDIEEFEKIDADAALEASERTRRRKLFGATPLRTETERPIIVAIVGAEGQGKETLAKALRQFSRKVRLQASDELRGRDHDERYEPYDIHLIDNVEQLDDMKRVDAAVLVIDPTDIPARATSEALARTLHDMGVRKVSVFISKLDTMFSIEGKRTAERDALDMLSVAGFTTGQVPVLSGSARGAITAQFSGASIWTDAFHGLVKQLQR